MTTTTLPFEPSHAELHMMLRAAVLQASAREHGREQATRVTGSMTKGLGVLATVVGLYDVALLLGIA